MAAQVIDGRVVAKRIQEQIKADAEAFQAQTGYSPGLGVILASHDPAQAQYVRMKRRACERVGITSYAQLFEEDVTQEQVLEAVHNFNNNPEIHGILIQLPLFKHIDEETILSAVSLSKDVDGFHPVNIGALGMKGREPEFTPATPTGCMVLLEEADAQLEGAEAVVVGRSNIVGLPMALMLLKANATVTVIHSRTKDMQAHLKRADVVVAAAGLPEYIQGDWLKPGAIVIDVGTSQVDAPETEKGYKFVGDVHFESAKDVVSAITQVPGGVGPMTITTLLQNTMKAAKRSLNV